MCSFFTLASLTHNDPSGISIALPCPHSRSETLLCKSQRDTLTRISCTDALATLDSCALRLRSRLGRENARCYNGAAAFRGKLPPKTCLGNPPSGMRKAHALRRSRSVRFALTPDAYGGKPSCSTGLTATHWLPSCSAGLTTCMVLPF